MRHLKSAFGFGTRTPGLRLKAFSQVFRYASDFVLWRRHVRMQPKGRCRDRLHAIKPFLHEVADRLHVLSEGRGDTALDWRNLGPQNSFVWRPLGAGDPFSDVPSIQGPISGFQALDSPKLSQGWAREPTQHRAGRNQCGWHSTANVRRIISSPAVDASWG